MNARVKARWAKLRRVPDDLFDLEADRRGFEKADARVFALPARLGYQLEVDLRAVGLRMAAAKPSPEVELDAIRLVLSAAEHLKMFREAHECMVERTEVKP